MLRGLALFGFVSSLVVGCGSDDGARPKGSGGADAGVDAAGSGGAAGAAGAGGQGGAASPVSGFRNLDGPLAGIAFGLDAQGRPAAFVSRIDANEIDKLLADGSYGPVATPTAPQGIAVAANGDLLVAAKTASGEGVIQRISGAVTTDLVGSPATLLTLPRAIAVAPDDRIVFSDFTTGAVRFAGSDGKNVALISGTITQPSALAFSEDGTKLFVGSFDSGKIWSVPRDVSSGSYGAASQFASGAQSVVGIVVMKNGDLLLVTSGKGVLRLPATGGTVTTLVQNHELRGPGGGAFGSDAFGATRLYVTESDANRVSRIEIGDGAIALPVR